MKREASITIVRYNPSYKKIWNDFVESSKNGTFLFYRDYMDYHADRFKDNSLLIYRKERLYALFPACVSDETLFSHSGLTYGGLITNNNATAEGVIEVFEALITTLRDWDIKRIVYKAVPYIYTEIPSQEDLYALFRCNASLVVRNISSALYLGSDVKPYRDRLAALKRAERKEIEVRLSSDFESFWQILTENLEEKYSVRPVHSLDEIKLLSDKFSGNISLFGAYKKEKMIAGCVMYFTKYCAHAQYISASPEGKKSGAVDRIIFHLIRNIIPEDYPGINYFDFGISNENGGRYLNQSLIYQKEGFGGRGVCYDTYQLEL